MALGAAIGRFAARSKAIATGWDGIRTATVDIPAETLAGTLALRRNTNVSGPGQN